MTERKQVTVHMLNWIVWSRTALSFNCVFVLDRTKRNHLAERKMSSGLF